MATTMACMVLTPIHTPPLSSSEDSSESINEDMSANIEQCALLRRQNPHLHLDQSYFEQQQQQTCYRMYHGNYFCKFPITLLIYIT